MPCGATARSAPSGWWAISRFSWPTTARTCGRTATSSACARTILSPKRFPGFRRTPSAPPASAGALRSTTGTRSGRAATTGGSIACAGALRLATTSASITFAASNSSGRFPPARLTAVNGRWVDGPKDELFNKLRDALGGLPFFAEDLGHITPEVHALRERHQIPGLAVLQFGFADAGAHVYLPHRLTPDRVVYTGTHDNDTTLGWWKSGCRRASGGRFRRMSGPCEDGIHWAFIRLAQESVASLAVVPLQDVLGLGSEGRLNTPSVSEGNFRWRYQPGSLTRRPGGEARRACRSDGPRAAAHARTAGRRLCRVKLRYSFQTEN